MLPFWVLAAETLHCSKNMGNPKIDKPEYTVPVPRQVRRKKRPWQKAKVGVNVDRYNEVEKKVRTMIWHANRSTIKSCQKMVMMASQKENSFHTSREGQNCGITLTLSYLTLH